MQVTMPFIRMRAGDAWFVATVLFDDVADRPISVSVDNATILPVNLVFGVGNAKRNFTIPSGLKTTLKLPPFFLGQVVRNAEDKFPWPFNLLYCGFRR